VPNRKRVAIDASPLLYGQAVGIARSTRRLVEALLSRDTDLELRLLGRRLLGPPLRSFGFPVPGVQLRLPRAAEPAIRALGLIETTCSADLYHATDFYLPLRRPENAVATIHDVIFLTRPEPMVDHARLARWVPEFARRCRRVITVSEFSRGEIAATLGVEPARIDVIPWAADPEVFRPEPDEEALRRRLAAAHGPPRPYFLAVSCSTGRKNTPMVLEAYGELLRRDPANDLVLVWDPPADLRERWGRGDAGRRVHFVPRQSDAGLRDLYCGATALVYPSRHEGFGLPVLESLSCGTPAIVSHTSALPEVAGDAGIYVDPDDPSSLRAAMERFETGADDRVALRTAALAQARRFSWERTAQATIAVYQRCLGG